MKYAIAYDITSNKRRNKVVKILMGCAYRVQKSVFEGFFTLNELNQIKIKLDKAINAKTDSIRFFPICDSCNKKIDIIGLGCKIESIDYLIV
ncbi:CRISPR-associated endonuclease Cas2 [bacterium]|nr:CRISPR-associated endonuclease Cas2 [bacterium]